MLKPKSLLTLFGAAALGALALAAPPASANLISCASGTLNCNLGSTALLNFVWARRRQG
jgi:hypothetical protein